MSSEKKRLAIIVTHPIQYLSPVFQLLSERNNILIKVFYTKQVDATFYDPNFQKHIRWDVPLLSGYDYCFQPAGSRKQNQQLSQVIANWHPHALLVFGWNPPGHFNVMRYFKGKVPVWFRGDSTLLDERPGLRRWVRRVILFWVYRHIDKAFFVGAQNKYYFLQHGVKKSQLTFAPHAIDNDRFVDGADKNYEINALQWRRSLGIRDADFVFLFAGKLESKKAPELLLSAFKELTRKNGSLRLHMIFAGSGPLSAVLVKEALDCTNIHFIGFQNQSRMPVVYRLGNVFCLPSRGPGETWGLAVNEALACNRQVIVSDKVGCAKDLVQDETPEFVFPANNLFRLVSCMEVSIQKYKTENKYLDKSNEEFLSTWNFINQVKTLENCLLKETRA